MKSKISDSLKLTNSPFAVIITDEKPEDGVQFKEGRWGCVAAMIVAASKGKTAFFDRNTFGCMGGGTGIGFGDQYKDFPIEQLLSTGDKNYITDKRRTQLMQEGERYIKTPELARKFIDALPMRDVPAKYILFKPLELSEESDKPELVIFLVNADQLSALVVLANYARETSDNVIAPFGAGCQSIIYGYAEESDKPELIIFLVNADQLSGLVVLANYARETSDNVIAPFGAGCQSIIYGYAEAEKENPRAVIGFFDISARPHINKDLLSFTVPYKMFIEMESNVESSFLKKEAWMKLCERIE